MFGALFSPWRIILGYLISNHPFPLARERILLYFHCWDQLSVFKRGILCVVVQRLLYLWSVEMSPPLRRSDVYSGTEQVFPIAEKKLASMKVGVTLSFFVRLAGRIVERGFNLVAFSKLLAILFVNSYESFSLNTITFYDFIFLLLYFSENNAEFALQLASNLEGRWFLLPRSCDSMNTVLYNVERDLFLWCFEDRCANMHSLSP